jgi:hypothetical protein
MYADAVDSFYEYVKGRILTLNPARQIFGIMDAADWPPKSIEFSAFYLLTTSDVAVGSRNTDSAAIPVMAHNVQWVWMILGTDLTTGTSGRNRGDKYRTNMQMKTEILNGLYPGFCQKFTYASAGGGALAPTPSAPNGPGSTEFISWPHRPKFMTQVNKDASTLFSTAAVSVTDFTDQIYS